MSNLVEVTSPTLDRSCRRRAGPTRTRCRVGSGRHLVADGGLLATLQLLDTKPATTGVLAATYQPTRTNGGHEHLGLN
jgi:hypothetical protein